MNITPISTLREGSVCFLCVYMLFNNLNPPHSKKVSLKLRLIKFHNLFSLSNVTQSWVQFIYINKPRRSVSMPHVWNNTAAVQFLQTP